MKIWVDDIRPSPEGYKWIQSVDEFINWYSNRNTKNNVDTLEIIDMDHDAGDWSCCGGDYIKIIDFLEKTDSWYKKINFKIHSMNPVGRGNLERAVSRSPYWGLIQ